MLIWKGWGILALVIPLVCSWTAEAILNHYYGPGFYQECVFAMPLVLAGAALPVWGVGLRLHKQPGRILIDPESHEQVELKPQHSMFWIPLRYWSPVILILSLWMYLANVGYLYQH